MEPVRQPNDIRHELTALARSDEVVSPIRPELLAGGAWSARRGLSWPPGLAGGVIEPRDGFRFRPENVAVAALLAGRRAGRVLDLGAGSGSLLLIASYFLRPERSVAVELQPAQVDRLGRTIRAHGLEAEALLGDVRTASTRAAVRAALGGPADLVVFNPPYYPAGWGRPSADAATHWSTHAEHGGVTDFMSCASELLDMDGTVLVVYDAARLAELLIAAGAVGLGIVRTLWIPDQRPGRSSHPTRCWVELSRSGSPVAPL